MRFSAKVAAVCCAVSLLGACARPPVPGEDGAEKQAPAVSPGLPAAAKPYAAPARPPLEEAPLVVQASADAEDRLGKAARGALVDSGGYHGYKMAREAPDWSEDGVFVDFMSPDGSLACTGGVHGVMCQSASPAFPKPPRPTNSPAPVAWQPLISLTTKDLSFGVFGGGVNVFPFSKPLPAGSTIRLGEIECAGETDGITCVNYRNSTGFEATRDALTPLRSPDPLPADSRAEPRTPGSKYCGALVTERAVEQAAEQSWPTTGKLGHWRLDVANPYTCADVQPAMARREQYQGQTLWSVGVLIFDKGRFVGPATDRPYDNLSAEPDPDDPTLVRLRFALKQGGSGSARAQCRDGKVVLLDSIPDGAQQAP
ncbi:hypothetical protein [Segniliparus rugosus]|uniref:Uncharacterized protein n=1 Tax=Segniliparus rugosus (strain ATCC BAA-974 / DSM 45345 / CCUG 50838 / CIP 108380 / JCM 13579 / CDC 945) TaxID=679197 RepID=E5XPL4_SEGRC|nr:hypothetical protein [Segniliparus rugosus]EFV13701.2 hypothetical protein HMPREF9336_01436 [Segniliparus rugosus ATCC BAA-974]